MTATVVHLSGEDGLLEAAARMREAAGEGDLVLVVPEGAPVLANPLFLRALQGERPDRQVVLATPDLRARQMASGCRLPAYASVAAYEQKSVDPTERLERARAAAIAEIGRQRERERRQRRRAFATLALALALLLIVGPSAEVIVAADALPVGPLDVDVRSSPGGAVPGTRLAAQLGARVDQSATGVRVERTKATGMERFTNASTQRIDVPVGAIVSTSSNVQFRTTQAKMIPPSAFFPFFISEAQIPIEAVEPGTGGNVARGAITRTSDPRLRVTNDQPTTGGDEKRIPVVQTADYAAALSRLDQSLDSAAREQLRAWMALPPAGLRVEEQFALRTLSRTQASDVVGKELDSFQLSATAEVSAYAVAPDEPRATAVRRLIETTKSGYDLVADAVTIEVTSIDVGTDGLVWRVRARAAQRPHFDENALRWALVGQEPAAAAPLLAQRGLRVIEVRSFPSWWPRLPFFPLRIDIHSGAVATLPR